MHSEERVAPICGSHLTDDQLMETYVLGGENRHLTICRQCRSRFDELDRALQHVRDEGIREADGVFTPERLHDQRDRIMRRLERHGLQAEVVRFPSRSSSQPAVRLLGPARRWVAGAAAAGLAAGLFLGFAMDRRTHYAANASAMRASATAATWQATTARDDQFFTEIDDALMGSRAVELRAIDTMTTPVEIREAGYPR